MCFGNRKQRRDDATHVEFSILLYLYSILEYGKVSFCITSSGNRTRDLRFGDIMKTSEQAMPSNNNKKLNIYLNTSKFAQGCRYKTGKIEENAIRQ